MSRVDADWPDRSSPVSSTSRTAASTKPCWSAAQVTVTTLSSSVDQLAGLGQARRDVVLAERLDHALGGPVPGMDDGDPVALAEPAADVLDRLLDVAAVLRRGTGGQQPRGHGADLDVDARRDDLAQLVAQRGSSGLAGLLTPGVRRRCRTG